jgi:hypothetical protein
MKKLRNSVLVVASCLMLSGCGMQYSDSQRRCITGLEFKLKSPSSLKLVSVSSMEQFYYPDELKKEYFEPEAALKVEEYRGKKGTWVRIDMVEYDASNSFGAMLRENEHCHNAPLADGGREDLSLRLSGEDVNIPQDRIRISGF